MFLKQSSIWKQLCHKNTSIQCFKRSIFRQLVLSELGVRHAGPIPGIPMCVNLKYKRECCCWLQHPNTYKSKKKKRIYPFIQLLTRTAATQSIMRLSSMWLCSLLLILKLQLTSMYPISTGLTDTDMDILKVLLSRLEESVSEQMAVDQSAPGQRDLLDSLSTEDAGDGPQPDAGLDEAEIREFLSAKNLKSVRNDSSRRSSGCFGRRMDRIGSMSSLGCNTVGRYNPKQR
ncbi:unnamed protein product [Oreochromis niloticus]|uniref:Natriuretic peptide B n=2 Tax=Oreochromis niloticus TaxID=8128 RepID=I3KND2_ORENI|nr:unnamed protein product [Mustela putorius furo]